MTIRSHEETHTWSSHSVLQHHLDETLPGFVARWVTAYDWRRKMRAVPLHVNLHDSEVRRALMCASDGEVVADG